MIVFITRREGRDWEKIFISVSTSEKDPFEVNIIKKACRNRANWLGKKGTSEARTSISHPKIDVYSFIVFHSMLFPDDLMWDSTLRYMDRSPIGQYKKLRESI